MSVHFSRLCSQLCPLCLQTQSQASQRTCLKDVANAELENEGWFYLLSSFCLTKLWDEPSGMVMGCSSARPSTLARESLKAFVARQCSPDSGCCRWKWWGWSSWDCVGLVCPSGRLCREPGCQSRAQWLLQASTREGGSSTAPPDRVIQTIALCSWLMYSPSW